ncbi:MAG: hypothetical protein QM820_11970 [Minicystis sp.]
MSNRDDIAQLHAAIGQRTSALLGRAERRELQLAIEDLVREINAFYTMPRQRRTLMLIVEYLAATHPNMAVVDIIKLLEDTARKGEKEIKVSVLDQLRQEGREEGRREGGARLLLAQLAARFGAVPAKAKARVLAADDPMLSAWAIRMLTAPTLVDAIADAPPRKRSKPAKKLAPPAKRPAART